jgi:starch phosphorylase
MAWLAMRGCSRANGVSRLHGEVSRRLFAGLFPRLPVREVPVNHVTNGVHVPSWDSPWTDDLWTRAAGKERWRGDVSALTADILRLSDDDLWSVRAQERRDLVRYARERLQGQLARRGPAAWPEGVASTALHADALTLGIARRFAGYKRPNLLLSDPPRLLRLLTSATRPVQLIVAGKAHPQDEEGKRLLREWAQFAATPEARAHVVLLEDYDIRLATELVQGVDVWINTPRRPWEASGTSGMKVLVNGGLNLSTLDGWWAEAYQPDCGWALGNHHEPPGAGADAREAAQLYALLEDDVVPAFYERDADGLPRRWITRMRSSMATLAPRFSSVRMLQEYVEQAYLPAAAAYRRRAAGDNVVGRQLEAWWRHLEKHWPGIRFGDAVKTSSGGQLTVCVPVDLGQISPETVRVELYADPEHDEAPLVQQMMPRDPHRHAPTGFVVYVATAETTRPPSDFTARVVPFHPDAMVPIEAPFIAWG